MVDRSRSTEVWGVLNVTPDSFSDGGKFHHLDPALDQARLMIAQGARVVDVGGESTRPGSGRVPVAVELERVLPVISALTAEGIPTSIDTMRSEVAAAAVAAGASFVNDVSGGLADPEMHSCVADLDVPYVLMHWRGHSELMDSLAHYESVVAEVLDELLAQVEVAIAAGINPDRIRLDPGFGFAKNVEQNWQLLAGLPRLVATGFPIMVGASRKRFLAAVSAADTGPADRDDATAAVSMFSALNGAWAVRVHDVPASVTAVSVASRLWEGS